MTGETEHKPPQLSLVLVQVPRLSTFRQREVARQRPSVLWPFMPDRNLSSTLAMLDGIVVGGLHRHLGEDAKRFHIRQNLDDPRANLVVGATQVDLPALLDHACPYHFLSGRPGFRLHDVAAEGAWAGGESRAV